MLLVHFVYSFLQEWFASPIRDPEEESRSIKIGNFGSAIPNGGA